jgi:hypothetical protein
MDRGRGRARRRVPRVGVGHEHRTGTR